MLEIWFRKCVPFIAVAADCLDKLAQAAVVVLSYAGNMWKIVTHKNTHDIVPSHCTQSLYPDGQRLHIPFVKRS